MSSVTAPTRSGRQALRWMPHLGLLLAAIAVLLLALTPIGWRSGWWGLGFSLLTLMAYSAYFGIAAAVVSLVALLLLRSTIGGHGIAVALVALIIGGVTAYVPWHYLAQARSAPPINDITTDTENPLDFVAIIPLLVAEHSNPSTYAGPKTAALQKQEYPDIGPLSLPLAPDKAFALALASAEQMGWTIVATDPASGRIEASQRSFWMGFTDDIVLSVEAAGLGSRIDIRSAARHGRSDLGVNAARIRAYLAMLRAAAGTS